MKILTIRGENVASLRGPFELALQEAPLADAGVFAIVGPTGVGKTTILDTMCLALFDQVPRFRSQGTYKVADSRDNTDQLTANDVKNFLRKGAVSGYAEVEFEGVDGRVYRARWSVRRARGKVNGKIQDQKMELWDALTEENLGDHRKKHTLAVIRERLGLDFQQFCRSVLLAQGEFAAFLNADTKERSELMERMTGTEIYSKLSEAAFQRFKTEDLKLVEMRRQADALDVWSQEQRSDHLLNIQEKDAQVGRQNIEFESLGVGLNWFARETELAGSVTRAEEELGAARSALQRHEDASPMLFRVKAVLALQPMLEAREQTRKQVLDCENQLKDTQAKLKEREDRQAALLHARVLLEAQARAAQKGLEDAEPMLKQAEALDRDLEALGSQKKESGQRVSTLKQRFADERDRAKKLRTAQQEQLMRLETLKPLVSEGAVLGETWWPARLARLLEQARLAKDVRTDFERLDKALQDVREAQSPLAEKVASSRAELAAHLEALARAKRAYGDLDHEGLRVAQQEAAQLRETWKDYGQLLRNVADDREAMTALVREEEENQSQLSAVNQELKELGAAVLQKRGAKQEAERGLSMIQASVDLADRRVELLHEDEPCPLCGSPEHPYRDHEAPGNQMLRQQKQRLSELENSLETALGEEGRLQARLRHLEQASQAFTRRKEEKSRSVQQLEQAERERREKLPEPHCDGDEPELEAVRDYFEAARDSEKQAALKLKEADVALKQLGDLQKVHDHAREHGDALAKQLADHEAQLQKLSLERTNQQTRLVGLEEELSTLYEDLKPLYSDHRTRDLLEESPNVFQEMCEADAGQWRSQQTEQRQCETSLAEIAKDLVGVDAALKETDLQLGPEESKFKELCEEITLKEQQRQALFDGRAVTAVREELKASQEQAQNQLQENLTTEAGLKEDLDKLNQAFAKQQERITFTQQQSAEAQESLDDAMAEASLEQADLVLAPHQDAAWVRDQEKLLAEAQKVHQHAQSVLGERTARLTEHREAGRPELTQAELQASRDTLAASLERNRNALADLRAELKVDDGRRDRLAEATPKIEAQEEVASLWGRMNTLIGAADGNKFRKFAQSLTLEMLLELADAHLSELAPRYNLQRVPGEDLEIQVVDRYMGDEIRPINSLSGGERFLVSLALALGLSSLSAEKTKLESLFIDEGFGSLDATTLDEALSALDNLQAGGRQIGIISHLNAVAERVGVQVAVERTANGMGSVTVRG